MTDDRPPTADDTDVRTTDPDGWVPVDGVAEPAEEFLLDDLDVVADLTHPVRGAILRRLKRPRTVAEVATVLDVPVTRLYHHVNRLTDAGLVRVVATRQVAAVTERRYQVVAKSFKLDPAMADELDGRELAAALGALFDVAKLDLQHRIESRRRRGEPALEHGDAIVSLGEHHLTPERHRELIARLVEVITEFDVDDAAVDDGDPDDGGQGQRISLFIAAFPSER